jgi:hypothetical protein
MLLGLIPCSQLLFGQPPKQRKSYPANIDKIQVIKSSYSGCILGPCYTWWSIALKDNDELLMQSGAHHPVGARSRHYPIGTWRIYGDTLKLKINQDLLDTTYMQTEYRIAQLYEYEILLPMQTSKHWDKLLEDIKLKFEQTEEYKFFKEYQVPERTVSGHFINFVRLEYSADNRLLFKDNESE